MSTNTPLKIFNNLSSNTDNARKEEFIRKYRKSYPNDSPSDNDIGQLYDAFSQNNRKPKTSTGFASSFLGKTLTAQSINRPSPEKMDVGSLISFFTDTQLNELGEEMSIFEKMRDFAGDQIILQLEQELSLQRSINEETSLTGDISKVWRNEIMQSLPFAERIGLSFYDVEKAMSNLITSSGRFKLISQETIESLMLQSKAFFDNINVGVESLEQFQKVSMGASDAMEVIEEVGLRSLSLGLNAKETVKVLVNNLEKMNQYGFKNGVEGLSKMIRQAQALRFDMTKTFDIATKVMDPDNALSLASNLQVIGGALGDFNDPIKMMWMATNNVEGLQDALVKSVESLVTFDNKSGTFKVVGADLRRAKAMADELGMSMNDVTNLAIQSAQRTSAAYDIGLSSITNVTEDDIEFLTNLSQMKDGKMVISVPDDLRDNLTGSFKGMSEIALKDLNDDNAKFLIENRKAFKEMSSQDIILQQVGLIENINRDLSFIAATMRVSASQNLKSGFESLGISQNDISKIMRDLTNEGLKGVVEQSNTAINVIKDGYSTLSSTLGLTKPVEPKTIETNIKTTEEKNEREINRGSESNKTVVEVYHKIPHGEEEKFWSQLSQYPLIKELFVEKGRSYTDAN